MHLSRSNSSGLWIEHTQLDLILDHDHADLKAGFTHFRVFLLLKGGFRQFSPPPPSTPKVLTSMLLMRKSLTSSHTVVAEGGSAAAAAAVVAAAAAVVAAAASRLFLCDLGVCEGL